MRKLEEGQGCFPTVSWHRCCRSSLVIGHLAVLLVGINGANARRWIYNYEMMERTATRNEFRVELCASMVGLVVRLSIEQ